MSELRVKCPRCGKLWTARATDSDVPCNCHLYCPEGSKPSDCNVSAYPWNGLMNYPRGMHGGASDDADDVSNVDYYCSIHQNHFYKAPVLIEVDWTKLSERARSDKRYFGEGT